MRRPAVRRRRGRGEAAAVADEDMRQVAGRSIMPPVPAQHHDQRVTLALALSGCLRFPPAPAYFTALAPLVPGRCNWHTIAAGQHSV